MGLHYLEPKEETYTTWRNPLPHDQCVQIFHDGDRRPTLYRCPAGGEVKIPSRYDYAIHRVHNSTIIGGLAPQWVKLGSTDKLDPALDTRAVEKKQAEVEAARAAVVKREAEDSLLVANARAAKAGGKG